MNIFDINDLTSNDVLNLLPMAIIVLDNQNRIRQWLAAAEEIYGYSTSEIIGRPVDVLYDSNDDITLSSSTVGTSQSEGQLAYEERIGIKKNNSRIFITSVRKPLTNHTGDIVGNLYLDNDITKYKKMNQAHTIAKKHTSLTKFAGGVAHDLNNVLTAVIGSISLLKMYMEPKTSDDIKMVVEDAEVAANQGRDLTENLMAYSKGLPYQYKLTDPVELVRATVGKAYSEHKIACEVRINIPSHDRQQSIRVDRERLSEVIVCLLKNAYEATDHSGAIWITIDNATTNEEEDLPKKYGKYIQISVHDDGIGIEKEHIERIFDPYFTTKDRCSGLSLASVYATIQQFNGYIRVESELGLGSIFTIFLPQI